jgi:peptide/nickel transport system substrate-binding protein
MACSTRGSHLRLVAGALILVVVAPLLAGCAATTTATPTATPKVFTFGRYTDAIIPDPVMTYANRDIWYLQQYYSGLFRFDDQMEIEGDLAERWEVGSDGLTYTFYLRPGLKFADGTPVTPEDWLWSLNRARDPNNGAWFSSLSAIDTIQATEDKIVFKLKEVYVPFIYSLALFNSVVMPKAEVEAAGGWEQFMESPVGAGPFMVSNWTKNEVMILDRNRYYWEQGKPVVDQIVLKTIPDDNARVLALQKGDVDAINFVPRNRVAELQNDPNIEVLMLPSTSTIYLILNTKRKPLDDKRVRKALSYAIDRDALVRIVAYGVGQPATTFRPHGSLYFNVSLPGWPYDVEKAKALLAEAGYADGFSISCILQADSGSDVDISTVLREMWAKVGVTLNIQSLEPGLRNEKFHTGDFDSVISYWTDDIPDPSQATAFSLVYANAESFHTGFQNDEIDQLAADALKEMDPVKREQMYWRIQEIYNDELPFLSLWDEPYIVAVRKNVKNFFQTPLGTYMWRDLDVGQ